MRGDVGRRCAIERGRRGGKGVSVAFCVSCWVGLGWIEDGCKV